MSHPRSGCCRTTAPLAVKFRFLVVALSLVQDFRHESKQSLQSLADLLVTWLSEDRENRPDLCLTLVDLWQEWPGIWSEETPEWVCILGAIATTAHVKDGPFGRCPSE